MYTHLSTRAGKIRKPRRCSWCGIRLMKGAPSVVIAGVWRGDFSADTFHPECHAAMLASDFDPDDGWEVGGQMRGKDIDGRAAAAQEVTK